MFTLKLESKYLIPSSAVQDVVEDMKSLHSISQEQLKCELKTQLMLSNSPEEVDRALELSFKNSSLSTALSSDGALRSSYMRNLCYTKKLYHNRSIEIPLGLDSHNDMQHYTYVPVKETLRSLLSQPDIMLRLSFIVETNKNRVYREFTDGRAFQNRMTSNENVAQIILYQDAFENVNPRGSGHGKFKMLAVYLMLGNLPSFLRTVVDSQQLVLLCREADFKHFGCSKVFERLISDLQDLEEGITVDGCDYIGQLAFTCGDNLGSHCIGGFVENFSRASYTCRFCVTTMQDFKDDKPAELKTVSSYTEAATHAKRNEADFMEHDSPFNKLSTFHVCLPGLPPFLGHDLFEGVIDYDLALMIKHFVTTTALIRL
ncbi:uncharacterized protein [Dermacentor albipictus]|uniref:uncharacterized protein n=1 Tax=Dermacentor albipictus TaxID=60249 RepID=UPI0038FCBB9C